MLKLLLFFQKCLIHALHLRCLSDFILIMLMNFIDRSILHWYARSTRTRFYCKVCSAERVLFVFSFWLFWVLARFRSYEKASSRGFSIWRYRSSNNTFIWFLLWPLIIFLTTWIHNLTFEFLFFLDYCKVWIICSSWIIIIIIIFLFFGYGVYGICSHFLRTI